MQIKVQKIPKALIKRKISNPSGVTAITVPVKSEHLITDPVKSEHLITDPVKNELRGCYNSASTNYLICADVTEIVSILKSYIL
jgi:hypothetical protein